MHLYEWAVFSHPSSMLPQMPVAGALAAERYQKTSKPARTRPIRLTIVPEIGRKAALGWGGSGLLRRWRKFLVRFDLTDGEAARGSLPEQYTRWCPRGWPSLAFRQFADGPSRGVRLPLVRERLRLSTELACPV
jgi:hypothetical protein